MINIHYWPTGKIFLTIYLHDTSKINVLHVIYFLDFWVIRWWINIQRQTELPFGLRALWRSHNHSPGMYLYFRIRICRFLHQPNPWNFFNTCSSGSDIRQYKNIKLWYRSLNYSDLVDQYRFNSDPTIRQYITIIYVHCT